MVNVKMDISSIMILPEEVRSVIFNLIPQKETVNIRLVCRAWYQEIQNNYEYNVKLDEDSRYFKSILQLRIKKLMTHKLESTPVLNFDKTSIFKHPNTIQSLVIGTDALVAPSNLLQLINLFAKNLRALHLYVSPKMCNYRFPSNLNFNFKKLRHLYFGVHHDNYEQCEYNTNSLFQVFENSFFPNHLKNICVCLIGLKMTLDVKSSIVGNVMRLISKQGEYLENIFIDITSASDFIELPVPLKQEELLRIKQIKTLKRVSLGLFPASLGMAQFWGEILCDQKHLKLLSIFLCGLSLTQSVSLIQNILNKSATLQLLYIQGIPLYPTDPPFDLSIFQNSPALKVLQLSQTYETMISRSGADPHQPDVVNFHCLPSNLVKLVLVGLKVLSEEVLSAFQSNISTGAKGFKVLQDLALVYCGNQRPLGINGVVLNEIMMTARPNLTNVCFDNGFHKEEAAMKNLLNELQLPKDTHLGWKRDSSGRGWKKF